MEQLTMVDALGIAYQNVRGLRGVVGIGKPYIKMEEEREVYKAPLLVKSGDRTIEMVGMSEITMSDSGKILKVPTQEELDRDVYDIMSRMPDKRKITS
jgi:hypothetical protein